jgi:hypothetical protein
MGMNALEAQGYPTYLGMYRAKVENDMDPQRQGRIQARVYPMFVDVEAVMLPWAVPAPSIFAGAGQGFGEVAVPAVGSYVFCFFEAGDYRQPVYFASAPTALKGQPVEAVTNYPKRKVWKTAAGVTIYVDDLTKEVTITQGATGGHITITADGKFKMGNAVADVVGQLKALVDELVTGYQVVPAGPAAGAVLYSPTLAANLLVIQTLLAALKGA